MQLLRFIKDKNLPADESTIYIREASRAVLFDEQDFIPILYVTAHNYHKLPGGGIETGEDRVEALMREVMEEVGSQITVTGEVGQIIEYRSQFNMKQISYCYYGQILSKGSPSLTPEELSEGFKLEWLTLDEAIAKMMRDHPSDYEGTFIQQRDLLFLQSTKEILSQT